MISDPAKTVELSSEPELLPDQLDADKKKEEEEDEFLGNWMP